MKPSTSPHPDRGPRSHTALPQHSTTLRLVVSGRCSAEPLVPRPRLEGSALRICARHDPRHLHMASHVGADAQDMSWLTGLTVALQGVRVAGVTKPLHGGLEPARTTHDEVHGWDTRTQDRLGTTSLG